VLTRERRDGEYRRKQAQSSTQPFSPPPETEPNNAARLCNRIDFSLVSSHSLLRLIGFNKPLQTARVTFCCLHSLEVNKCPINHRGITENSSTELKNEIMAGKLEASHDLCKGAPELSPWTAPTMRGLALCGQRATSR